MKKIQLLILVFIFFSKLNYIYSQTLKCDSILVYAYKNDYCFSPSHPTHRALFLMHFWDLYFEDPSFVVRETINDQKEIYSLLTAILELQPVKTLRVDAEHIEAEFFFNNKSIIEVDPLDNQMCLILHYSNHSERIIWLSKDQLDRGNKRYNLNKKVKNLLSKYCCIDGFE